MIYYLPKFNSIAIYTKGIVFFSNNVLIECEKGYCIEFLKLFDAVKIGKV